jgi:DNA-binding transcriptional LysR family regulator
MDPSHNTGPQLPALLNRQCDLVIRHFQASLLENNPSEDLNAEVVYNDRLVVVAGLRSRWARRRKVDLADLIDEPWILSAPDSWNYKIIVEAFRARGLDIPQIRLVTLSLYMRADMAASGECIATFPASVARFFSARSSLKVLPVILPSQPLPMGIVTLKKRTLSPVVECFIEHLREFTQPMREA